MKKKITIDFDVPTTPNFIRSKDHHTVLSIRDFSNTELRAIGAAWTLELIRQARKRKKV